MPDFFDSGVFGQNTPAWHGKGKVVAGTFSYREALELGDLDWEVRKVPLYTEFEGARLEVPDKYGIQRKDNGRTLGITGPEYRPIQNRDAFGFLEQLLSDRVCRWETAISVDNGRTVAGIISLADTQVEIVKGDHHFLYLTVISSHDGSSALKAFPTDVRVVCANTVRAALNSKSRSGLTVNIRHSGNVADKIKAGQDVIARARSDYAAFTLWQQQAAQIAVKPLDYQQLMQELFPAPLPQPGETKVSQRSQTMHDNKVLALSAAVRQEVQLLPQFSASSGGPGAWSAYTFLNGVTRYVDHDLAASGTRDRAEYALIGGGVDLKAKAMQAMELVFPQLATK